MKRKQLPKNFRLNRDDAWERLIIATSLEKEYPLLDHKRIFACLCLLDADLQLDCLNDIAAFKKLYKNRKKVLNSYKDFAKNAINYIFPLYHSTLVSDAELAEFGMAETYERLEFFLSENAKIISFIDKFIIKGRGAEIADYSKKLSQKDLKYSDNVRVSAALHRLIPYLKSCGVKGWKIVAASCELLNRVLPIESNFNDDTSVYNIMRNFKLLKGNLKKPNKRHSKKK